MRMRSSVLLGQSYFGKIKIMRYETELFTIFVSYNGMSFDFKQLAYQLGRELAIQSLNAQGVVADKSFWVLRDRETELIIDDVRKFAHKTIEECPKDRFLTHGEMFELGNKIEMLMQAKFSELKNPNE